MTSKTELYLRRNTDDFILDDANNDPGTSSFEASNSSTWARTDSLVLNFWIDAKQNFDAGTNSLKEPPLGPMGGFEMLVDVKASFLFDEQSSGFNSKQKCHLLKSLKYSVFERNKTEQNKTKSLFQVFVILKKVCLISNVTK